MGTSVRPQNRIVSTYPGLDIFLPKNCFRYFSIDSVVASSLEDDLHSNNIKGNPSGYRYLIDKIYKKCVASTKLSGEVLTPDSVSSRLVESSPLGSHSSGTPARQATPTEGELLLEKSALNFFVFYAKKRHISRLSPLFYLMSLLPPPHGEHCYELLQDWELTFNDVLLVFLNWGATMVDFGFDKEQSLWVDFQIETESLTRTCDSPSATLPDIKENLKLILVAVTEKMNESTMSDYNKMLLLRLLVYSAMEKQPVFRRNVPFFRRAIIAVLQSFRDWDHQKAVRVVEVLDLKSVSLENSGYTCCTLLETSGPGSRLELVRNCTALHLLQTKLGLGAQAQFPNLAPLAEDLESILEDNDRFAMWELFSLAQLLELLLLSLVSSPHYDEEVVRWLVSWAERKRDLMSLTALSSVDTAKVRERLLRLVGIVKGRIDLRVC